MDGFVRVIAIPVKGVFRFRKMKKLRILFLEYTFCLHCHV